MATRTIRILSVQPVAERGGSDQALLRMVRSLPRDEFEVHVAVPAAHPLGGELEAAGARLHVVAMERLSTSHGPADWMRYLAGWPVAVARLVRLARRVRADVIHTNSLHSWYGWAVARVLGLPHVWHAREIVVQSRSALRLERALCRNHATTVIAVSHAVAAQLDPTNVVVLDEPLDPEEFGPHRAGRFRARVGLDDDDPVVGTVARLDPLKGIDVLLDALDTVRTTSPEVRVVVLGAPVLGQEEYAARLRDRLARTPGAVLIESRPDVPEVVADLDVFVLASIEPESYGLALVEALASGVPSVATDHGGPPELAARARPGSVRLVPPGDAPSLAAAITQLLPERTSAAARRARVRALEQPPPGFADVFRWVAG